MPVLKEKVDKAESYTVRSGQRQGQELGHDVLRSLDKETILKSTLDNVGLPECFTASRAPGPKGKVVEVEGNSVLAEPERLEVDRTNRASVTTTYLRDKEATQ
jgi:hypothetical protein